MTPNIPSAQPAPLQAGDGAPFLTLRQVAHQLNISRRTAVRWIEAGLLPAYRFGTVIRVRPQDLEDVIRNHTIPIADRTETPRDGGRVTNRKSA